MDAQPPPPTTNTTAATTAQPPPQPVEPPLQAVVEGGGAEASSEPLEGRGIDDDVIAEGLPQLHGGGDAIEGDAAATSTASGKHPPAGRGCVTPGCAKYRKSRCDGYCLACYRRNGGVWPPPPAEDRPGMPQQQQVVHGDGTLKHPPPGRGCLAPGCRKYSKSRCGGYCLACYRTMDAGGAMAAGEMDDEELPSLEVTDDPPPGLGTMAHPPLPPAALSALDAPPPPPLHPAPPPLHDSCPPPVLRSDKPSKHCLYGDCARYKQSGCYGYCLTHVKVADPATVARYTQKRAQAEAVSSVKRRTLNKRYLCKWAGCERYVQSNCRGYCLTHVKLAQYEEDDGRDVTKVRVRVVGRLLNGFGKAVLPMEVRAEWGFPMPVDEGTEDGNVGEVGEDGTLMMLMMNGGEENHDDRGGDGTVLDGTTAVDGQDGQDVVMQDAVMQAAAGGEQGEVLGETHVEKPVTTDTDASVPKDDGDETMAKPPAHENDGNAATASEPQPEPGQKQPEEQEKQEKQPQQPEVPKPAPDFSNLDFDVAPATERKSNGAIRCRALEKDGAKCPKNSQGAATLGFCRLHHNRYLVQAGICGTWDCDNCRERMTEYQTRCGKCHRWRGGSQIDAMTMAAAAKGLLFPTKEKQANNEGTDNDDPDGLTRTRGGMRSPWECLKCGIANPGAKKRCGGCLTWRGMGGGGASARSKARPSMGGVGVGVGVDEGMPLMVVEPTTVEDHDMHWRCGRCRLDNFAAELECFSCRARRPNYQWHKRQKLIGVASDGVAEMNDAAPTASEESKTSNTNSAGQAKAVQSTTVPDRALSSEVGAGVESESGDRINSLNYYGTCQEGVGYHHISIHYDFNQSYYRNCQYSYLSKGIKSAPAAAAAKTSVVGVSALPPTGSW